MLVYPLPTHIFVLSGVEHVSPITTAMLKIEEKLINLISKFWPYS